MRAKLSFREWQREGIIVFQEIRYSDSKGFHGGVDERTNVMWKRIGPRTDPWGITQVERVMS